MFLLFDINFSRLFWAKILTFKTMAYYRESKILVKSCCFYLNHFSSRVPPKILQLTRNLYVDSFF